MPKPVLLQRPLTEEIEEIKSKLALLAGDKKAYYESSHQALDDCKKRVVELRKENSRWRLQLKDRLSADDNVINQAFQNKPTERAMLVNKTTPVAMETMDHKVCDKSKKLNFLKHITATKLKQLNDLQFRYNELSQDNDDALATVEGSNKEGQQLRDLENRLDKVRLKCSEAKHIKKTYDQIKSRLEEEHLNYGNNLDTMEEEIKRCREEIKDLKIIHQDSILARNAAVEELRRKEDLVFSERRRRDLELASMKQVAQVKQMMQEKVEKRIAVRDSTSIIVEDRVLVTGISEEQQKRIADYDKAFQMMKEATGINDLDEVVLRFENQGDTKAHLDDLKREAEKTVTKLRESKSLLQQNYAEINYSGELRMSNGESLLEEYKLKFDKESQRRLTIVDNLRKSRNVLVLCKSGIEHIYDKVHHLKMIKSNATQSQVDVSSDELVLDMLSKSEERLVRLLEQMSKVDIKLYQKRMREEESLELIGLYEFQNQIENKLPAYNVRIQLPKVKKDNVYEDEEDSGDDDADVLTRNVIKRQSKELMDMKAKKRNPKKKKKAKAK